MDFWTSAVSPDIPKLSELICKLIGEQDIHQSVRALGLLSCFNSLQAFRIFLYLHVSQLSAEQLSPL